MTTATILQQTDKSAKPRKKEWAPRLWEGCNFFAWAKLLFRGRFAVNWRYWYIAIVITIVSSVHTLLQGVQWLIYGTRIRRTPIPQEPIFIIGHWRTGTTFLHELLILDPRHNYPNTYQCLEPNHFLLTESLFKRWLWFLMPSRRPMDNMAAGWDRPQEDEFALCMKGRPSPYLTIAFPNQPPKCTEYLDLEGIEPKALTKWKKALSGFLQCLTFKDARRLILKSPPHMCRIKVLLEMFPDARFVHIVRDPYVVFASTVNLWKSLYETHGMQKPTFAGLEEYVYQTFTRMYASLEDQRGLVPPNRFYEVRYEDLVKDPVNKMRDLYSQLEIGGFDEYLPQLEDYLAKISGYETNRYTLDPGLRSEISRRWGAVIRRYGYE